MRYSILSAMAIAVFSAGFETPATFGQSPPNQPMAITINVQKLKQAPDEFKSILNVIEEAYKAPREVDADVLDELRKQYRNPTPEREQKIIREVRRLYQTTPEREEAILREVRRSCELQTREQEDRLFVEIRKGGQLALGAVQQHSQIEFAAKLFARLDQDGNGSLNDIEQPETLRTDRGKWDRNLDGAISLEEYTTYYQTSLKSISEKVASGEIYLKAAQPSGAASVNPPLAARVEDSRPVVIRVGRFPQGLPDWFIKLDKEGDNDGQVGLYEWKLSQKPLSEFSAMDLNGDGLLTAEEYLRWSALQNTKKPDGERVAANDDATTSRNQPSSGQSTGSEKRYGPPGSSENGSGRFGPPGGGFGPPMNGFGPPPNDNGNGRFGKPKGGFKSPNEGDSGSRFGQPRDGNQGGDNPLGKMFRKKG